MLSETLRSRTFATETVESVLPSVEDDDENVEDVIHTAVTIEEVTDGPHGTV